MVAVSSAGNEENLPAPHEGGDGDGHGHGHGHRRRRRHHDDGDQDSSDGPEEHRKFYF